MIIYEFGNKEDMRKIEIHDGKVYLIYGDRKNGKTATLLKIASKLIEQKRRVLFVDIEKRYECYSAIYDEEYSNLKEMKVITMNWEIKDNHLIILDDFIRNFKQIVNAYDDILIDNLSFPYFNVSLNNTMRRDVKKFENKIIDCCYNKTLIITSDFALKTNKISGLKVKLPKVSQSLQTIAEKMIIVSKELEPNAEQIYHYWQFHTNKIPFKIEKTGVILDKNIGW